MRSFKITNQFLGYRHKQDETNLGAGYLVNGSTNVVSTDGLTIASRQGYTLYGAANAALTPIISSYDWYTSTQVERHLRSYEGELEVLYNDTWYRLKNGWSTAVGFEWAEWWDSGEVEDFLLFCNGTPDLFYWNGAITTLSSVAANAITKQGTNTWAQDRFYVTEGTTVKLTIVDYTGLTGDSVNIKSSLSVDSTKTAGIEWTAGTSNASTATSLATALSTVTGVTATASGAVVTITATSLTYVMLSDYTNMTGDMRKKVNLGTTTYYYKGGETTTTLTGVLPTPAADTSPAATPIFQSVATKANLIGTGYNISTIDVLTNQLWVGSKTNRDVYISYINAFTNFSFASPRLVGQGALITLDSPVIAFVNQDEFMYISAGRDFWYQSKLQLSADNTAESLTVKRLKSAPQQGARSQSAVGKIKNATVFISFEPTFDYLGNVENFSVNQSKPLSDLIKLDFDEYDFADNTHTKYFKNNVYIAIPNDSKLLIYNLDNQYWEAPQDLPAGRLAVIEGELYLHSNAVPETYKLFDGYNDNDNAINAVARFSYMNFGLRANTKAHTEWYTEGYISPNTTLTQTLYYDYHGATKEEAKEISGADTAIILQNPTQASLGKASLGKQKLGGTSEDTDTFKFRVIKEVSKENYYEIQPEYSTNGVDQRFELIAFGADVHETVYDNSSIKQ